SRMHLSVRKHPRALNWRDHVRDTRCLWNRVRLVPIAAFNFRLQRGGTPSLNAQRRRVHDDFQEGLCTGGVVAQRNIDVVAKVRTLPGGALDKTRDAARALT